MAFNIGVSLTGDFIKRLRDYHEKPYELCCWREGKHEIDVLVKGPKGILMAFECKTSAETIPEATVTTFRKSFKDVPIFVVSLKEEHQRKLNNGVIVLPWQRALTTFLQ